MRGAGRAVELEQAALAGVSSLASTKTGADRASDPAVEGGSAPARWAAAAAEPVGAIAFVSNRSEAVGGEIYTSDLEGATTNVSQSGHADQGPRVVTRRYARGIYE